MNQQFIHLKTHSTSYVLLINQFNHLENLYYGAILDENEDLSILINKEQNPSGTSTVYSGNKKDVYSLNYVNLEIGTLGKGDYRSPSVIIESAKGFVSDFIVKEHGFKNVNEVLDYDLPLPHGFNQYYYLLLEDKVSQVVTRLDYLVFSKADVIARRVVVISGHGKLNKIASMNLDIYNENLVLKATYGGWAAENKSFSQKLNKGIHKIRTNAGPSSNRHNPLFLLVNEDASLDNGHAYGFNLMYSGPFSASLEVTPDNRVRIQHGINEETFSKELDEEIFATPFAVMTFSNNGENGVSQHFHAFVQNHVVRPEFAFKRRPILLNNWEATYFDFKETEIKHLIKEAATLGMELFVLDDGWFINRNNDFEGLGHYDVNHKKLPHGLKGLSDYAKNQGLKFGIWLEPEMLSGDLELFKNKPHFVVQIPDITPSTGRFQYAFDLSLPEVQEYIIEQVSNLLESADISYVKWDYNRNLSDFYTATSKFSTFFYDYTKGLYKILATLISKFPHILWEGCASGGNRFDLGVLSYFDQIWVSDCSDAYERVHMHKNLAKGYPFSVMSAHVSAVPNHQVLRELPLETRFNNAFLAGGFGYELDVLKLTLKEKKQIKEYNEVAKACGDIVINATYYELSFPTDKAKLGYALIDKNKENGLVLISNGPIYLLPEVNKMPVLPLNSEFTYHVYTLKQSTDIQVFGSLLKRAIPKFIAYDGMVIKYLSKRKSAEDIMKTEVKEDYTVSGKALNAGALVLYPSWMGTGLSSTTRITRDFTSVLYFITKKEENKS